MALRLDVDGQTTVADPILREMVLWEDHKSNRGRVR